MRELLAIPTDRPLPTRVYYVRPYVLDEEHRRRRWQDRIATGETAPLPLAALLEIATPVPAAA